VTHRLELSAGLRFFDCTRLNIYSAGYVGDSPRQRRRAIGTRGHIIAARPRPCDAAVRGQLSLNDIQSVAEVAEAFATGVNQRSDAVLRCRPRRTWSETCRPVSARQAWSYTSGKEPVADDRTRETPRGLIQWKNTQTTVPLDCSYYYTQTSGRDQQGIEIESAAKLSRYARGFNGRTTIRRGGGYHQPQCPAGRRSLCAALIAASRSYQCGGGN